MSDNIVQFGNQPPTPQRYSRDGVPPAREILDDLAEARGNIVTFLNQHVKPADQELVMFKVLVEMKKDPLADQEWEMLVEVGDRLTCTMLHARLLDGKATFGPDADTKEIIAILERLMPGKWGRKSVQKQSKGNEKLSDLMKNEE